MNKMRILAISQYGWPEPYPALYPMEEMVKRGHYVHAITGTPNYPMGKVYSGYEHNKISNECHNGIYITHVPVIPRKNDVIHRILNYYSYPIMAKRKALRLKDEYDVIFANQSSPVMMVEPAIAYGRKRNKRVVMHCMDLWPASLCVGGVKKDSLIYKYYWKKSKEIYKCVDVILVTSRMFKQYLINEFNIPDDKIGYLPQYSVLQFENMPSVINKNTTDFVFAGNVGIAQNLEVVLRAAKKIEQEHLDDNGKRILFHIVGDGQDLNRLQKYANENRIDNVIFHGRKSLGEMPAYYAMADAMIVTMISDPLISLTLPAKVQGYMAAGKPILASAGGEIKNVINEAACGFCGKPNDVKDFIDGVEKFLRVDNRLTLGERAKKYYLKNFSVNVLMDKLETILFNNCR